MKININYLNDYIEIDSKFRSNTLNDIKAVVYAQNYLSNAMDISRSEKQLLDIMLSDTYQIRKNNIMTATEFIRQFQLILKVYREVTTNE